MVALANFCFGFTAAGLLIHFIAYLIGVGYRPSSAALVMSMMLACSMSARGQHSAWLHTHHALRGPRRPPIEWQIACARANFDRFSERSGN
jgi:hypothetical protein